MPGALPPVGPHRTQVPAGPPGTRVHLHVSVTGNTFSKRPPASKNASITIAVRDEGRQVGVRPGLAETGVPGTAVTLCHCGQLSAPAASCHSARHKTYPLSGPAGRAEPEAALVISFVTSGLSAARDTRV